MSLKRPNQELKENFIEQIDLIKLGIKSFDAGNLIEAINLAVIVRKFVHDTQKSTSLLQQIGIKNKLGYRDSALDHIENELVMAGPYIGLMQFVIGNEKVFALVDDSPNAKRTSFHKWRNGKVFIDYDGTSLSRREVIRNIANKKGAHVDLDVDSSYEKIIKNNSLGIQIGNNSDGYAPIKKLEYIAVRQIVHELLKSIFENYSFRYLFEGNGAMMTINF